MNDYVSLNRSFLMLARQDASDPAAPLSTGLPQELLAKLKSMTIDQVDELAKNLPVSVFTMRLSAKQMEVIAEGDQGVTAKYVVAALAERTGPGSGNKNDR